ncbi:hypothetical protein K488DRAFT_8188, partial [Vararia minispora EC-137]
ARFPGAGNTIGTSPAPRSASTSVHPAPPANRHPESSVQIIMNLGVTREVAISTLDAANGNLDVAASLLF